MPSLLHNKFGLRLVAEHENSRMVCGMGVCVHAHAHAHSTNLFTLQKVDCRFIKLPQLHDVTHTSLSA